MKNELLNIESIELDEKGIRLHIHVTEEVNVFIVWYSRHYSYNREFFVDKIFKANERDKAIVYAVEKAKGIS